jgi:prepilin-type N-terminal cleavage/methylation domain-containing protein
VVEAVYGLGWAHLAPGVILIASPFAIAAGLVGARAILRECQQDTWTNARTVSREDINRQFEDDLKRGFTVIEMLIVVGILAILMALAVPTAMKLRQDAKADATRLLTDKAESAFAEYSVALPDWPDEVPTAAQLQSLAQAGRWADYAEALRLGNRHMVSILEGTKQIRSFRMRGGSGGELVDWQGDRYMVDSYWSGPGDMKAQPVDTDGDGTPDALGGVHFLCFVREGHKQPSLDIYSSGPDGVLQAHSLAGNIGDDIVNWQ